MSVQAKISQLRLIEICSFSKDHQSSSNMNMLDIDDNSSHAWCESCSCSNGIEWNAVKQMNSTLRGLARSGVLYALDIDVQHAAFAEVIQHELEALRESVEMLQY